FLLGVRLLADVRVKLARQAAVGLLDLVHRRRTGHAEYLVVVPVFHECLTLGSAGGGVEPRGRWGHPCTAQELERTCTDPQMARAPMPGGIGARAIANGTAGIRP